MTEPAAETDQRPFWQRALWLTIGLLALATGIVGIVLPLLPTTPIVLLAAFCFTRSSRRCEHWLLNHPRFGPMVSDWRAYRAVPLRAKQLAWSMMLLSSLIAWYVLPGHLRWIPAVSCTAVAAWLWTLPTRR